MTVAELGVRDKRREGAGSTGARDFALRNFEHWRYNNKEGLRKWGLSVRLLKAMHENERFSSTEQAVIHYILEHPKEIVDLSIRELAERTFTSSAAIFRLCQKLSLKGYNEFKIKFISEINRVSPEERVIVERPITDQDSPDSIVRKMAALEVEAIEETKNEMDMEQLHRIIGWMQKARIIDFYAYDQNFYLAQMAVYNLLQIKYVAVAHSAMNSQYAQALNANEDHVAMIISRSGENKRLIAVAKVLKEKKVKTVLFTCTKESTLAQFCDEFLYVANTAEYLDLGGMIFSVGLRYYQDVLFSLLLSQDYQGIEDFYNRFENILGHPDDKWRLW